MRTILLASSVLLLTTAGLSQSGGKGLAVGARIPAFELEDQNGQKRSFDSIKGRKGALLLFHRSADW